MLQAYIGTYTKQNSQGIYLVDISDEGQVIQVLPVAQINNPTYLALSHDKQTLYSVASIHQQGGVASFSVQDNGQLLALDAFTSPVNPPCYVAINSRNDTLLSANYHTATINHYHISKTHQITETSVIQHQGQGPHSRQEKAHAHYANFTPDEQWILTCDLGTDEVNTYRLDQDKLTAVSTFHTIPGSGPRHLIVNQRQNYVYIMTELTSQVIACRFNHLTGELSDPMYYDTLPTDFIGENKGSAIRLSNDEQYLYVSNRGQDAIVIFKVDGTQLTLIDTISTYGQGPRDFNLSPDGTFAIATNENSHTITVYQVNSQTGLLTVSDKEVNVPEPVSVVFR